MFSILIIDDMKPVHTFVKTLMGKVPDIQATSVFNGSEALSLLKTGKTYDLILLDWEMPELNGPETLQELLNLGVKTPVVMMTTKNDPSDIQKMIELGAAEYLMKPFTIDILFDKIEMASGKAFNYAA
jgi:two-component system chemotaxis response regulator CheY